MLFHSCYSWQSCIRKEKFVLLCYSLLLMEETSWAHWELLAFLQQTWLIKVCSFTLTILLAHLSLMTVETSLLLPDNVWLFFLAEGKRKHRLRVSLLFIFIFTLVVEFALLALVVVNVVLGNLVIFEVKSLCQCFRIALLSRSVCWSIVLLLNYEWLIMVGVAAQALVILWENLLDFPSSLVVIFRATASINCQQLLESIKMVALLIQVRCIRGATYSPERLCRSPSQKFRISLVIKTGSAVASPIIVTLNCTFLKILGAVMWFSLVFTYRLWSRTCVVVILYSQCVYGIRVTCYVRWGLLWDQ